MPYRWLEDAPVSDAGFEAWGSSLGECFQAAADALLALMLGNPESLQGKEQREVAVEHDSLDLLLVRFLEEILYFKDAEQLFLRAKQCEVGERSGAWQAVAQLEGERVDPERHWLAADVKAVTLHRLRVEQRDGVWIATVVVDL